MLSLRREAQSLTQQIDSWAESDLIRSLKKKNLQDFRKKNREKNRDQMVMLVESSEDDLEEETGSIRKRSKISEEIGNGGKKSSDLMDEDYRLFLEKIGAFLERDLMETGDREEDFGSVSKDLENSSPNEVVVVENVERFGAVSKDLVDSTPNEVVVVEEEEEENVELNENAMILREDSPDPDYKNFLDNLKVDGQSYVFENVRENGTTESIWYGREDEDLGEFMDVEAAEHVAVATNIVENLEEVDTENDCIEIVGVNRSEEDNQVQKRRKDFSVMRNINAERLEGDLGLSGGYRPGKKDVQATSVFLSGCQPEMIIHADDAYMAFLSHVRVTGKSLIYEHGNSIVVFDEDTVVVPDSEELEKKPDIHGKQKKFTPHSTLAVNQALIHEDDSDEVEILPGSPTVDSEGVLRKKLKKILKRPFDKKEFKVKLKAARIRKPLEKNRPMRGRDITYQTDDLSPSYLDLHPDLRNMLRSVRHEKPKPKRALSLLRCLFFYYKNVCHPGSCQPWKRPPSWLHNKICSCPDYLNCHTQRSISQGKRRRVY